MKLTNNLNDCKQRFEWMDNSLSLDLMYESFWCRIDLMRKEEKLFSKSPKIPKRQFIYSVIVPNVGLVLKKRTIKNELKSIEKKKATITKTTNKKMLIAYLVLRQFLQYFGWQQFFCLLTYLASLLSPRIFLLGK